MISNKEVSPVLEEYLEALYRIEEKKGVVKTGDLAKELRVALGTITNTIKSMERQNLIVHTPYKGVKLTAKGRKLALDVIRRHRLSERLLTDILKMDWSEAHELACKLEHALTDIIEPLERALGNPKTCPHGHPIPSEKGELQEEESVSLSDLNSGEKGIVVKVTDESPNLLSHLSNIGLVPGARVKVIERTAIDDLFTVKVGRESRTLSGKTASVVWVKKEG